MAAIKFFHRWFRATLIEQITSILKLVFEHVVCAKVANGASKLGGFCLDLVGERSLPSWTCSKHPAGFSAFGRCAASTNNKAMAFLLIMVAMKYIEGKCEVCHHHVIRGRSQGRAKHVAFA
jgi:hypothetical protein